MRLLDEIRKFMLDSVAELRAHPDKLQVWTDDGELSFKTLDPLPNHRNAFTANVLVTDYAGSLESLAMPLMTFYKKWSAQSDDGKITYEAEIIDHCRADVLFSLRCVDNVNTTDDDGVIVVKPICDPVLPWFTEAPGHYTLIYDGKEIARWTT